MLDCRLTQAQPLNVSWAVLGADGWLSAWKMATCSPCFLVTPVETVPESLKSS